MQITEADLESARARGYLLGKEGAEKLAAVEVADLRRQVAAAQAEIALAISRYKARIALLTGGKVHD